MKGGAPLVITGRSSVVLAVSASLSSARTSMDRRAGCRSPLKNRSIGGRSEPWREMPRISPRNGPDRPPSAVSFRSAVMSMAPERAGRPARVRTGAIARFLPLRTICVEPRVVRLAPSVPPRAARSAVASKPSSYWVKRTGDWVVSPISPSRAVTDAVRSSGASPLRPASTPSTSRDVS